MPSRGLMWPLLLSLAIGAIPSSARAAVFGASGGAQGAIAARPALAPGGGGLQAFHLLSETQGWVLLDGRLYWSSNGGNTWVSITPPNLGALVIQAVSFRDERDGWLVLADPATNEYALATTGDGGKNWQVRALSLFSRRDPAAVASRVWICRIDARSAWIVVRQSTSINFSSGTLFKTSDGGATWVRREMPIGEPVYFIDADTGWTVGGATGTEFYRTTDGGRIWQSQTIGRILPSRGEQRQYYLPRFDNLLDGTVPVLISGPAGSRVEFFRSHNGGQTWELLLNVPLAADGRTAPLIAQLSSRQAVVVDPHDNRIVHTTDGSAATIANPNPALAGFDTLDMVTTSVGWARRRTGRCTPVQSGTAQPGAKAAQSCTVAESLVRTADGGRTWQALALPGSAAGPRSTVEQNTQQAMVTSIATHAQTFVGQAFDKCEVAQLSQLQEWWTNSPYAVVNLYIGGSARSCGNTALNADYVYQISRQGWRFIPTWVGPQAPCSSRASKMSSDVDTAYAQGVSQANLAIQTADSLGLATGGSGAVIYYDLEAYEVSDSACRAAANSFISGWSGRLQATGNVAGAYGAAYMSAVSDWLSISHVPDALWLAHWLVPYQFRIDATVWDPDLVPDSGWANHQRIRQYAGDHSETWASTTLTIDSSVVDGIVATYGPTFRTFLPSVIH